MRAFWFVTCGIATLMLLVVALGFVLAGDWTAALVTAGFAALTLRGAR